MSIMCNGCNESIEDDIVIKYDGHDGVDSYFHFNSNSVPELKDKEGGDITPPITKVVESLMNSCMWRRQRHFP